MKKIIHRTFFIWNFEKEIAWLNEMSRQGWQLCRAGFFVYEFEQGQPGEYQYQLQLLRKTDPDYLAFLEETGIQVVGRCLNWIYLKKKSDGQPFEIFSDLEGVLRHLDGVMALCGVIMAVNVLPGFANLANSHLQQLSWLNLALAAVGAVGFCKLYLRRRALTAGQDLHR